MPRSSKQEPLGRGLQRGFRIPSEMGTTRAFGASLGAQVGPCLMRALDAEAHGGAGRQAGGRWEGGGCACTLHQPTRLGAGCPQGSRGARAAALCSMLGRAPTHNTCTNTSQTLIVYES